MKITSLILLFGACIVSAQSTLTTPPKEPARLYLHLCTLTQRIITMQVHVSEDFYVAVGLDTKTLTGHIEPRGQKYLVTVEGRNPNNTGIFKGEITLEEPVMFREYATSGVLSPFYFVLSASSDFKPFREPPLPPWPLPTVQPPATPAQVPASVAPTSTPALPTTPSPKQP